MRSSRTLGRAEAFAAWRSFLEELAERRLTVLVFEDLHWGDDALLGYTPRNHAGPYRLINSLFPWPGGMETIPLATPRRVEEGVVKQS